jgi:hypothetical protein
VDARRNNKRPRNAIWTKAEMLCAEPYRVEVSTIEKGAGAAFAGWSLVWDIEKATRIFSRTRRRQEAESSGFLEVNAGTEKGMTNLLLRGKTAERSQNPEPFCLQVRTRIRPFGCPIM